MSLTLLRCVGVMWVLSSAVLPWTIAAAETQLRLAVRLTKWCYPSRTRGVLWRMCGLCCEGAYDLT